MSLVQNISINSNKQSFKAGDDFIDFKKARKLVMYLAGKNLGTKKIQSTIINPKKGQKLEPNVLEITFSKSKEMITLRKHQDGGVVSVSEEDVSHHIVETLVTLSGFELRIEGQRLSGGFNKVVKENITLAATPANFINTIKSLFGVNEIPEKLLKGLVKTSEFKLPDPFGLRRLKSGVTSTWGKAVKKSSQVGNKIIKPFKKIMGKSSDLGFDTNM